MCKKDGDNALSLKGTQITLAKEDLIRKAEIIWALKCVESNHLFWWTSDDSKIFKEIYQKGETKTKYTIRYGINSYLNYLLLDDIKNIAFTFKFDKSTTQ